MQNQPMS